jgi:hypothetical protein
MYDYGTGLDMNSFKVVADFDVDGAPAGTDLAPKFHIESSGVWKLQLSRPIARLAQGKITVSVGDRQGNQSRIERTFSVGSTKP